MKKLLSILFLSSTLLVSLTGCGSSDSEVTNEFGLIEDGKLYVATNPTYAPFEYMEGTEMVGFDIDLLDAIGEMAGVEVEYTSLDFDTIIPAVKSGQYDLGISGFSVTEERKEQILFSDPYYSSAQVALLPADSTVTSIADLEGAKLGAGLGTTGEFAASELSEDLTLVDTDVALPMLNSGQLDAYICDLGVAQNAVNTGNYSMLDETIQSEDMAVVFSKDNEALATEFNKYLGEFMASEEYQELLVEYELD